MDHRRSTRSRTFFITTLARAAVSLACAAPLLFAARAEARTLVVTQLGERTSGTTGCTLREAIQAVNNQSTVKQCGTWDGASEVIVLGSGTYAVRLDAAADTLKITRPVTIRGNGYKVTAISRAGSGGATLFQVGATSDWVTFEALRIDGAGTQALAVDVGGWVQLNFMHVKNSGSGSGASYGCVMNLGNLFTSNMEMTNCQGWEASGIYNEGFLVMDRSAILQGGYGARGGAIKNKGARAQAYISNSTIAKNKASANCSALCNIQGAYADLNQTTVVYNFRDPQSSFATDNMTALQSDAQSTIVVRNSIVSSNYNKLIFSGTSPSPNPNCAGSNIQSQGSNFLGDPNDVELTRTTSPACVPNVTDPSDVSGSTLSLDKDSSNSADKNLPKAIGGIVRGYRPLQVSGNPVLSLVDPSRCLFTDQRGMGRLDYSPCEAGAVSLGHATVIVGNAASPAAADLTLKSWLEALGFFVYLVDDNAAAENLANPGLTIAVISSSVVDATIANKYRSAPIGMVVNKIEQLDNLRMLATNNFGTSTSAKTIFLGSVDSQDFGKLMGNTLISSLATSGSAWANTAGYDWIAGYNGTGGYPMVYFPRNSTGEASFVMPGGRISFPGLPSFFTSFTSDGKRMFEEAALWASRAHP